MSRSYWLPVFAVVGWLIAGFALAEETKPDQAKSQGSADSEQQKPVPPNVNVRILEEPEQSESDKRRQKETEQREKEDLAAQQAMADGTKWLVWVSIAQVALAFLGTIAILCSLALSRKAIETAIEANAISQKIGGLQVRAYMTIEGFEVVAAPSGTPQYSVRIKNTGQSPSYSVSVQAVASIDANPPASCNESTYDILGKSQTSVWGAGTSLPVKVGFDKSFTTETQSSLINREKAVVISGMITFRDIFGTCRWVKFASYASGPPHMQEGQEFCVCDFGNEASEPDERDG